jgi:hypothetical protein
MEMLSFGGRHYLDDRMFVIAVEPVGPADGVARDASLWAVTTRRNVPGYAVFRRSTFDSRAQAVALVRRLAPLTPRLSLHGLSPVPAPTYDEHNAWLRAQGLPPLEY